jgi:hypothetical protein
MSLNYLKYLFKKERNTNTVLLIIFLIIYPFINMNVKLSNTNLMYNNIESMVLDNFGKTNFITFMYLMTFVMVIFNFRYLHSKRAVDTYMQLPLTKLEIFKTKLIYTMIQVVGLAVVTYILGTMVLVIRGFDIDYRYIIYMSILLTVGLSLLLFINAYIYQKCNSMMDGIIIMLMYHLLFLFIDLMLMIIVLNFNTSIGNTFSLFSVDMTYFNLMGVPITSENIYNFIGFTATQIRSIVMFLIIGLGSLFLSFREIKNRSSERAEQITKDHFCYPVIIIGFVWILFMMMVNVDEDIDTLLIGVFVIFIPYIIGMFIYNRKVELKFKYIITYVVTLVLSFVFLFTVNSTDSFGMAKTFPNNSAYANSYLNYYFNDQKDFDLFMENIEDEDALLISADQFFYNNYYKTTTIVYNNVNNNIAVYSSKDIEKFENLMLTSFSKDEYNENNIYVNLNYYDGQDNRYDSRNKSVSMNIEGFITFVKSLN